MESRWSFAVWLLVLSIGVYCQDGQQSSVPSPPEKETDLVTSKSKDSQPTNVPELQGPKSGTDKKDANLQEDAPSTPNNTLIARPRHTFPAPKPKLPTKPKPPITKTKHPVKPKHPKWPKHPRNLTPQERNAVIDEAKAAADAAREQEEQRRRENDEKKQ